MCAISFIVCSITSRHFAAAKQLFSRKHSLKTVSENIVVVQKHCRGLKDPSCPRFFSKDRFLA